MAAQGSGGAYEVSTRMTALLGWGGTVGYKDSFAWDQVGFPALTEPYDSWQSYFGCHHCIGCSALGSL